MRIRTQVRLAALFAGTAVLAFLGWDIRAQEAVAPGEYLFVTNANGGSVTVVDRSRANQGADAVVTTIAVGGIPRGIFVQNDRVYVANTGNSEIDVIDTNTLERIHTITIASHEGDPWDVAIHPSQLQGYVTLPGSGTMAIVDVPGRAEIEQVPLPVTGSFSPVPQGIAITPDGSAVFVVAAGSSRLYRFDVPSGTFNGGTDIPFGAQEVAISATGDRGIVVGSDSPVFFDTATGAPVPVELPPFGFQKDVSVSGDFAFVSNSFFSFTPPAKGGPRSLPVLGDASIDVFRFSDASYVGSQAIPYSNGTEGIVALEGDAAFVCQYGFENEGTLLPHNTLTEETGTGIPVGSAPFRVARAYSVGNEPVVSFFLPTIVNMKLAGAGRDFLATGGLYDDGNLPADYADPVTVEVGSFSRTFTLAKKGSVYSFKDGVIDFTIIPNLRGSSRGRFKLKIQKTTLSGLVAPDGPVEIRFIASGLPNAAGTVVLEKGRYRRAKKRGALIAPPFFAGLGQFKLKGEDQDACVVRWGFSSGQSTPATLGDVRIAIGSLDMTVPGASFVKSTKPGEESFLATVTEGAKKVTISLDYKRELARVVAKGVELGPLAAGQPTDFKLDAGNGLGLFTNRVRLGGAGTKVFY